MTIDLLICDECLDKLNIDPVTYTIYIDLVCKYIITGMPIAINYCQCQFNKPIFQLIFNLERLQLISIFEDSESSFLIVPKGVDTSKELVEGVLLCNCRCEI